MPSAYVPWFDSCKCTTGRQSSMGYSNVLSVGLCLRRSCLKGFAPTASGLRPPALTGSCAVAQVLTRSYCLSFCAHYSCRQLTYLLCDGQGAPICSSQDPNALAADLAQLGVSGGGSSAVGSTGGVGAGTRTARGGAIRAGGMFTSTGRGGPAQSYSTQDVRKGGPSGASRP